LNFAVYHGTNFNKKELLIKSAKYDVFVCGHTHRTLSKTFGKTMVINPGTANGWFLGYKATAAIFDTIEKHIEFINL
jgi:putative phosphoesterase